MVSVTDGERCTCDPQEATARGLRFHRGCLTVPNMFLRISHQRISALGQQLTPPKSTR